MSIVRFEGFLVAGVDKVAVDPDKAHPPRSMSFERQDDGGAQRAGERQTVPKALAAWHDVARSRDPAALEALLAQEVVFESPVVFTPQRGKAITFRYLAAALKVLGEEFRYAEEWINPHSAVLEFHATINGIAVNGVDILGWDEADRIVRFKVMVRPLKGMEILRANMAAELGLPGAAKP